jgi:farnesyl-diphosphate farnesyltransferase
LLEKVEESLALLQTQSTADLQHIREVLDVITGGQELDLKRFGAVAAGDKPKLEYQRIIALQADAELDDYTYRVAGCVGRFWTRICLARQFPSGRIVNPSFEDLGVRFGKGLQLVNILRDIPADLAKGRCYLPAEKLAAIELAPADLLTPENEPKFRPLYNDYLNLAESHLAAGWQYTNLIPFGQMRLRLACAWPILIGLKTIGRLRSGNVLDAKNRIKISRREVWQIIRRTVIYYPFADAWRRLAGPGAH